MTENHLRVDQVLHGYREGHRRLAGSVVLDDLASNTMLMMSDLLNNDLTANNASYLTGYPLKSAHRYVIARTWAAPEMARPGCVWTHSLVMDYATVARLPTIDLLSKLFVRPTTHDMDFYGLELQVASGGSQIQSALKKQTTASELLEKSDDRLITTAGGVYLTIERKNVVLPSKSQILDEELVSKIWQQMWPRLRRGVLFCSRFSGRLDHLDADLAILVSADRHFAFSPPVPLPAERPQAFAYLVQDLISNAPTSLRRFLSRYGGDASNQRGAAIPLTDFFLQCSGVSDEVSLKPLAAAMKADFPGGEDCQLLKMDFLLGRLFPRRSAESFIAMLLEFASSESFVSEPLLSARIKELLNEPAFSLGAVFDSTELTGPGDLGYAVVDSIAADISSDRIVQANCGINTKIHLASIRSDLLEHAEFWPSSRDERLALWKAASSRVEVVAKVVRAVLPAISRMEADYLVREYGDPVYTELLSGWAKGARVDSDILRDMLRAGPQFVSAMARIGCIVPSSLEQLAQIIDGSEWEHLVSWEKWRAFVEASGSERPNLGRTHALLAVLFKAGLAAPQDQAVMLFAVSFDRIYELAANGALDRRVRKNLERRLPDLGFHREWDLCGRLRRAVLSRFLNGGTVNPLLLLTSNTQSTITDLLGELLLLPSGVEILMDLNRRWKSQLISEHDDFRAVLLNAAVQQIEKERESNEFGSNPTGWRGWFRG